MTHLLFGKCWDEYPGHYKSNPPSAECDQLRVGKQGGGKALVHELKFIELMFATHLELRRRGLDSSLKDHLLRATRLADEHARRWQSVRKLQGSEGEAFLEHDQGSSRRKEPGPCRAILGIDSFTGKRFDALSETCRDLVSATDGNLNFKCLHSRYGQDTHCPTGCDPARELVKKCREAAAAIIEQQAKDLAQEAYAVGQQVRNYFRNIWFIRPSPEGLKPEAPCTTETVYFKSSLGYYLEDRDGTAGINQDKGPYQQWKLVARGDDLNRFQDHHEVFIKSHRGKYLEDRSGKVGIHSDRSTYQEWTLQDAGGDQVFIKSHRGEYLRHKSGRQYGELVLSGNRGAEEKWNVTNANADRKLACNFIR